MKELNELMIEPEARARAHLAAAYLDEHVEPSGHWPDLCIIPGSGWGKALRFDQEGEIELSQIPGLESLARIGQIGGHEKKLKWGKIGDVPVFVLSRLHGYQDPTPNKILLRLTLEMLIHVGVVDFFSTSGVGALVPPVMVGDVVVATNFTNSSSYPVPLLPGDDFASAEDGLSKELSHFAVRSNKVLQARPVHHAIVLGPQLESRTEKTVMARNGAHVVGMSGQAAAAVCRLYRDAGVRFLMLGLVTNDQHEEHSHEDVVKRGAEQAERIGTYLCDLVINRPPRGVKEESASSSLRSGQGPVE